MPDWDAWGDPLLNEPEPVNSDMPVIREGKADDWVATCGVCLGSFAIASKDAPENPSESGTFCPDCRARRLKAPGVLHWQRRSRRYRAA